MKKSSIVLKRNDILNMHHRIRNSLNALLGFIQILDNDSTISLVEKQQYYEIIKTDAYSLIQNIEDILYLSIKEK